MRKRSLLAYTALAGGLALAALVLLTSSATARIGPPITTGAQSQAAAGSSWGSNWMSLVAGSCQTFTHGLGADPEEYVLDLLFMDTDGSPGVHRRNYGGLEQNGQWHGAYWQNLTSETIQVCRLADDSTADRARVRVWVPDPRTEHDSGWTAIAPGTTVFTHGLGITPTELLVGLWFRNPVRGIHQFGYGGLTIDAPPELRGGYWHNLTENTVRVTRRVQDTAIQQVRVVVAHVDPPDWDSDWQDIAPGEVITLEHNLSQRPGYLVTRGECLEPPSGENPLHGIHRMYAGGDHSATGRQGAHLQNLTAETVQVMRGANDALCPQFRVRIWVPERRVYLPVIVDNYAYEAP